MHAAVSPVAARLEKNCMTIFTATLLILALMLGQVFFAGANSAYALPMYCAVALGLISAALIPLRSRPRPRRLALVSVICFAAYIIGRTFFSPAEYLAHDIRMIVLAALSVYLVVAILLTGPRPRTVIVWGLLLLLVPNALVSFIQFFKDNSFTHLGLSRPGYGERVSGLFICPNHFAGFVEMVLPFCLSAVVFSRWPMWQKILVAYIGLMGMVAFVLTGSRGGYLSMAVGVTVWSVLAIVIRSRAGWRSMVALLGVLVVLGVLATGVTAAVRDRSPALKGRMEQLVTDRDFRLKAWPAAWRQFQEHPIWGAGAQAYVYYGRKYRHPTVQGDPIHVHNDYLQLIADYGAVGGLLGLFALVSHAIVGLRAMVRNAMVRFELDPTAKSDSVAWSVGSLAALAALAAHSALDFNLHIPANALVAAILMGFVVNDGVPRNGRPQKVHGGLSLFSGWALRVLLTGVGGYFLWLGITTGQAEYHREKARYARRTRQYSEAIRHGYRALELGPLNSHTLMILGDALRRRAIEVESPALKAALRRSARFHLERSVALNPHDGESWRYLGRVNDALGDFERARMAHAEALERDPLLGLTHEFLGWHYQRQERWEEAEKAYKRATELGAGAVAMSQLTVLSEERAAIEP